MGGRPRNSTPPPAGAREPLAQKTPAEAAALGARLAALWPDATVELDHESPYQLLVATILSAQSTDKMINTVTPALFARFPDPEALARADQAELERMVHSTGFFRMKAKHLIEMARAVVERHGGQIPETMEELCALPGVARKTANVVLGCALGRNEGVIVDTHVARLAGRLGLSREQDPVKIEQDLMRLLPRDEWTRFANRLIWHGRRVCTARQPDCEHCGLAPACPSFRVLVAAGATRGAPKAPPAARAAKAAKPAAAAAPRKPAAAAAPRRPAAAAAKPLAAKAPASRSSAARGKPAPRPAPKAPARRRPSA